ncbi:DUF4276 family protein [Leisingera aquaemixtae]|uniref:DUF4276 family protein n=1 Tax=Leisingera aquaemixtae TaxID=1396826 RepID=UPI0021A80799|nr:DUF4276 family protein [Leisingera aquaemixtae]UWQ37734.1 DUF4276 family protein [Leisingera aquaemixtae]
MTLIVFTEEPSMKEAIEQILVKCGVKKGSFRVVKFDGVGELIKALPRQLDALDDPAYKFLILRDNDNSDCLGHKREIQNIVNKAGRNANTKIRIVCQMLESWFIGDTKALEASKHFKKPLPKRLKSCDPDSLENPKKELKKLRDGYSEIKGAKAIAPLLTVTNNRSASFRSTVAAIKNLK